MVLKAENIEVGYWVKKKHISVQRNVSVIMQAGELVALIGPNGAGKSTLLRVLAGINEPFSGIVWIDGRKLSSISSPEKSRMISLVLTDRVTNNFLSVEDLVALGRYPYSGWIGRLNQEDKDHTERAIKLCSLEHLRYQTLDQLSDGERQRAMIARAIAQDTPIIILDEPTAHLDLKTRVEVLLLLRTLARETNKAIVVATHELELAIGLADEVWLMPEKLAFVQGLPEELILSGQLSGAFNSGQISFDENAGSFKITANTIGAVNIIGEGLRVKWTQKALLRKGFENNPLSTTIISVGENHWMINGKRCETLKELLKSI